jgi:hypothetical protein
MTSAGGWRVGSRDAAHPWRSVPRAGSVLCLAFCLGSLAPDQVLAADLSQRLAGTVTLAPGATTATATLSPAVDPTRSFLVFGVGENGSDPADTLVSGQITSGSTLTFQRVGTAGTVTVSYYVAEFATGVSVQRGSTTLTGSPVSVPLAAVDLTKSFPILTYRAAGTNVNENDLVRARITSTTTLQLSYLAGVSDTTPQVVEWQVVQYQDARVQAGDVSFGAAATTVGVTLPAPAVDPTKSWLLFSYACGGGGCPNGASIGPKLVRGSLANVPGPATTLTFSRSVTGPNETLDLSWYVAEFTDATGVQSGAAAFAGTPNLATGSYTGNGANPRAITGLGFHPDVVIVKVNWSAANPNQSAAVVKTSTLTGAASKPLSGAQNTSNNDVLSLDADGFTVGSTTAVNNATTCGGACTYYWVALRANPNVRVGTYTGNNGTQAITGLGFSPAYVIVIPGNNNAVVQRTSQDASSYLFSAGAALAGRITSLDPDGFSVADSANPSVNAQNVVYHYVAFNEVPGQLRVGTYAGTGATRNVTGVGFQPRFVVAKGLAPATPDAFQRSDAMPGATSINFQNASNTTSITALQADGFQVGAGTGVNAAGSTYSYVAFGSASETVDVAVASTFPGLTIATAAGLYMRGGQTSYAADDNLGVGSFTLDLPTATNLRVTRGTRGPVVAACGTSPPCPAPASVEWYAIRFAVTTTAVELMGFTARGVPGGVELRWQTGSELDNLGFHVWRREGEEGSWSRVTASLIPGLGSSPLGASYAWRDEGLREGQRYDYRLEDVDTASRSAFHGPVWAVAGASGVSGPPAGSGGGESGGGAASGGGAEPGGGEGGGSSGAALERKAEPSGPCPSWVLTTYREWSPANRAVSCFAYGDPGSGSVRVVSRDSRQATLEVRTGGFYAVEEEGGEVRVFVPGDEFPSEPEAPALPVRRALVDAVVGRGVSLVFEEAEDLWGYAGLHPAAVGRAQMELGVDGTVRAGRVGVRAPSLSRGYLPQHAARLVGTVFQGESKSAVVEVTPVRFDGYRQQLVLAKRVVVRLAFEGVAPGETGSGSVGRLRREVKPKSEVLGELHAKGRGLYGVRFEEVFPGRSREVSLGSLRLQRGGEAVGYHVEPETGSFGPGGVLYFEVPEGAASTAFVDEEVFELVRSREGEAMAVEGGAPSGPLVASASRTTAGFEVNRLYQAGLVEAEDVWLWEAVWSGTERAVPFGVTGVDPGGEARIELRLQGGSESGLAVDHHVRVSVNGVEVGEGVFAGKRPWRLGVVVPAGLVREGTNELRLRNAGDTGVYSLVYLDGFSVSYPQRGEARGGVFEGSWSESGTVEVGGLSGPAVVVDVTEPGGARWVRGLEQTGTSVRWEAEAGRRYQVVTGEGLARPRVVHPEPTRLRETDNQADYLLVAPAGFLEAAEPLLERRRSQGLTARGVSLEEITTAFGHGEPSGEAIRDFIAYAFHSWKAPSPRYVVLLGDSSYDPRNFTGTAWPSPLPALWEKTPYLWTVSDPALAAVNGEDRLPDLALGRLPATTLDEARSLVRKILDWEDSGQGLTGAVTLVADNPDSGGNFEQDSLDLASTVLAQRQPRLLFLRQLGTNTRPAILDAFDSGLSIMSYVGHGGAAVWASENVLNSWDPPSLLPQTRQPLLLTFNCLNGYFVAPNFDSLSEAFLKIEGRGAIAALSPSGLSLDQPAQVYHRALLAQIASGVHLTLGDAWLAAQRDYAQQGAPPDLLLLYQLLGDPALRIR